MRAAAEGEAVMGPCASSCAGHLGIEFYVRFRAVGSGMPTLGPASSKYDMLTMLGQALQVSPAGVPRILFEARTAEVVGQSDTMLTVTQFPHNALHSGILLEILMVSYSYHTACSLLVAR